MPTQTREIGGSLFAVTPLPAMRSFALQARIGPVLAEVPGILAAVLRALPDGADLLQIDALAALPALADAGQALARAFSRLPPAELEGITRELLAGTTIDGKVLIGGDGQGGVFDVVMQGRTLDTWRLLWFALQVQYPDFFARLGASAAAEARAPRSAA